MDKLLLITILCLLGCGCNSVEMYYIDQESCSQEMMVCPDVICCDNKFCYPCGRREAFDKHFLRKMK